MKKEMTYLDSVHRDGRIWNLSVMVLLLAFPVAVCVIFNVLPDKWMVAQSGITKPAMSSLTPFFTVWRRVTGIVAADDWVPNAVK